MVRLWKKSTSPHSLQVEIHFTSTLEDYNWINIIWYDDMKLIMKWNDLDITYLH